MVTEIHFYLPVFKFLSGQVKNICRLCFTETKVNSCSVEDEISFKHYYYNGTLTFTDMLNELGITIEPFLPQNLCKECCDSVKKSFMFLKFSQDSHYRWMYAINKLNESLDKTKETYNKSNTLYISIGNEEISILNSKKNHTNNNTDALVELKNVLNRQAGISKTINSNGCFQCEVCGYKFLHKYLLNRHKLKHKVSKYPCKDCAKIYITAKQLRMHQEKKHYPKTIQCTKCSQKLSTNKMLIEHIKKCHEAVLCKLCFMQLPSRHALRAHLDKHEVNICKLCNKSFINRVTYKIHLKICGIVVKPSVFCDICGKGYVYKNGLRSHLKVEHGFGKVLTCNWCSKKFDAHSKLKNHVVKHTGERNFTCSICDNKFVTQAALVYHTRLHTGEKPFKCDICSEGFVSASRRMEHFRRKHIGPKEKCYICPAKFILSKQLKKHVALHYNPLSKLFVPTLEPNKTVLFNVE